MNAMATRPDPIPFYAEMSSVNPIFLLPGALRQSSEGLVAGLFASITMGAGQFCTKPGLVLVESANADAVAARLKELMAGLATSTLLTPGIRSAYNSGVSGRSKRAGVATLAHKEDSVANGAARVEGALFRTDARSFLGDPSLSEEVFGPSAVLIAYSSDADLLAIARGLEGQLTATVHGTPEDLKEHAELLAILEQKAGRLILNGFPTGVEVGHATVHGGPWPATSDGRSTSVGSRAISRFGRLVCYQDFPQGNLPDELKDANSLGIWRALDGTLTRDPLPPR
jgi:NADP-dependent aldehyde dehydrogenase